MGQVREEFILQDSFSAAFSRFMQAGQGAESQLGKLDAANRQFASSSDYAAKQLSAMEDALGAKQMLYAAQAQRLEAQRQKVGALAEKYGRLAGEKGENAAATLKAAEALARAQFSEQAILVQALRTEEAIAGQNEKIQEFTKRMEEAKAAASAAGAAPQKLPPPDALYAQSLESQVRGMQAVIQQLSASPMDIGAGTTNAELGQVEEKLTRITREQEGLNRAAGKFDISGADAGYARLQKAAKSTGKQIRDNAGRQGKFNKEIQKGTDHANRLVQAIKRAVAAYVSVQAAGKAIGLSDQLSSTSARLELMLGEVGSIDGRLRSVHGLQEMIFQSAERSRGAYQATADAVSKMGLMAGNAFSGTEEVVAFMEQINKKFAIAGTEASGMQAAMLQLTQAMGAGVLRGEEYNSILEQAPNIVQDIARYIEGNEGVLKAVADAMGMKAENLAGNVQKKLKDIAGEGLLSAELVKAAMFAMADETDEKFNAMPKTFRQIWQSMENNALMAFQPILERLNEVANSEAFQEFADGAIEALAALAGGAVRIFDLLVRAGSFVAENWDVIAPILAGVAVAAGLVAAGLTAQSVATWIAKAANDAFVASLMANPFTWIAVGIGIAVAMMYKWIQMCGGITAAWLTAKDNILTAFDVVWIALVTGVYFVQGLGDSLIVWMSSVGVSMADAAGDMKVKVLTQIEGMVNGAIGLLNDFIGAVNKIPGVAIQTIDGVTFAASAAAKNEAEKAARADSLDRLKAMQDSYAQERDRDLESMKRQAAQNKMERMAEIEAARKTASGEEEENGSSPFDFSGMAPTSIGDPANVGKVGTVGNVKNVEGDIRLADEDVKLYRDLAERRYMNKVELETLAPVIHVAIPDSAAGNLSAQDVADYIRKMLVEQMGSHTAISHG